MSRGQLRFFAGGLFSWLRALGPRVRSTRLLSTGRISRREFVMLPKLVGTIQELETTITHRRNESSLRYLLLIETTCHFSDFIHLRCLTVTLEVHYREFDPSCVLPTMPLLQTLKVRAQVTYPEEGDPNNFNRAIILTLHAQPSLRHLEMHLEDTSELRFANTWCPGKLTHISLDSIDGDELSHFVCQETSLLCGNLPNLRILRLHAVSDPMGLASVLARATSLNHLAISCFHRSFGVENPCPALTAAVGQHLGQLRSLQLPPLVWDATQFVGLTNLTSLVVSPIWYDRGSLVRFRPVLDLCAVLPLVEMVRHGGSWFKRDEWLAADCPVSAVW